MNSKKERYLLGAIQAIGELMRSYGVARSRAIELARRSIVRGYDGSISDERAARRISRVADVCARWHIEKKFTDLRGKPRPLTWNGRAGSLLGLVRHVVGQRDAKEVISDLVNGRHIKRSKDGTWLPKSKVIAPVAPGDAQVLRTATMTGRLLRTVIHNSDRSYRGGVLLEVMAQVPSLPTASLSAFRRFSKANGISFIKGIDDWLEARNLPRARRSKTPSQEVGVVAFAFVQPRAKSKSSASRLR